MNKTRLAVSLVMALSGCVTGPESATLSNYQAYLLQMRAMRNAEKMPGLSPEQLEEAREASREAEKKTAALEQGLAQCQWEIRQMTMSRQQPTYIGTVGFNDPQMGVAANQLAAALAATPSPALLDECMAAKGFRY